MRGALRLSAHAAILTVAWGAILTALIYNSYFLYEHEADDDDERPIDF